MYVPNDHLGAAHRRLHYATPDERDARAPANHSGAPTCRYDGWQHFPQEQLPLPNENSFIAHHALSLPPGIDDCHGPISPPGPNNYVSHYTGYSTQPCEVNRTSHQLISEPAQHYLPTPPLRNKNLRPSLPRGCHPEPQGQRSRQNGYIPNGLPSSPHHLLPQTRAYLGTNPNGINTKDTAVWNTDGGGNEYEDWEVYHQSHQTPYGPSPPTWDFPSTVERQAQCSDYANPYPSPQVYPPVWQYAPHSQPFHTLRASSVASSPVPLDMGSKPIPMPAVQDWRTDNLATSKKACRRLPDAVTRRKQEAYCQKAEACRNAIASRMDERQTPAHSSLFLRGRKPKMLPPAKRRKVRSAVAPAIHRNSRPAAVTTTCKSPFDRVLLDSTNPVCLQTVFAGYDAPIAESSFPTAVSVTELPHPTPDELPQSIVSKYEDYKWSIYRYELLPVSGYDFAQPWVEALFTNTLQSEHMIPRFYHVSRGFIKDGGRQSLLVLHNAADPFEYEPTSTSTITIGVYGYHWYQHNEIHWMTLASDQCQLLVQCLQAGFVEEKHKWKFDETKASEKRFHRAYWLAANRHDLKDLLNRGPSDDRPHDLIEERSEEDPDQDFTISKADLTKEWDVTDAEAAVAWQKVQDEVDALGERFEVGGTGWQHVVIANSEW